MSLAQLLSPPPTEHGLQEYHFSHFQHHKLIVAQIAKVRGVDLKLLDIYPVSDVNMQTFLENHQQLHDDYESLLGIQGNDLSTVDFKDEKQASAFYFLNFTSHRSAAQSLGGGV